MQPPQSVLDAIRQREGEVLRVYRDSEGHLTAGVGHKLVGDELTRYRVGDPITQQQSDDWLVNDASKAYTNAIDQAQRIGDNDPRLINALTPVNFQLGQHWWDDSINPKAHKNTWNYLVNGDYNEAAKEIYRSNWYEQTPVRVDDFANALRPLAMEKIRGDQQYSEDTGQKRPQSKSDRQLNPIESFLLKNDLGEAAVLTAAADPEIRTREAPTDSLITTFKRAAEAGTDGLIADFNNMGAIYNLLRDNQEEAERYLNEAQNYRASAAAVLDTMGSFKEFADEPTFERFFEQAAKGTGMVSAMALASIASGLSTALIGGLGKATLSVGARKYARDKTAALVDKFHMARQGKGPKLTKLERDYLQNAYQGVSANKYYFTKKGASKAQLNAEGLARERIHNIPLWQLGFWTGSFAQGEVVGASQSLEEFDDAGYELTSEEAAAALALGVPQAFLDVIGEKMFYGMFFKTAAKDLVKGDMSAGEALLSLAKAGGKGLAFGATSEGVTEAGQEGIVVAQRFAIDPDYSQEEALLRIGEAGFIGAIAGGARSAPTNVIAKAYNLLAGPDREAAESSDYGDGRPQKERREDVAAQIISLIDGDKPAVWIPGALQETLDEFVKFDVLSEEQANIVNNDLNIFTIQRTEDPKSSAGVLITRPDKVGKGVAGRVTSEGATDKVLADVLGYSKVQDPDDGYVITVKDKQGRIIQREAASEASVTKAYNKARRKYSKDKYDVIRQTKEEAVAEVKKVEEDLDDFETQQAAAEGNTVDPADVSTTIDPEVKYYEITDEDTKNKKIKVYAYRLARGAQAKELQQLQEAKEDNPVFARLLEQSGRDREPGIRQEIEQTVREDIQPAVEQAAKDAGLSTPTPPTPPLGEPATRNENRVRDAVRDIEERASINEVASIESSIEGLNPEDVFAIGKDVVKDIKKLEAKFPSGKFVLEVIKVPARTAGGRKFADADGNVKAFVIRMEGTLDGDPKIIARDAIKEARDALGQQFEGRVASMTTFQAVEGNKKPNPNGADNVLIQSLLNNEDLVPNEELQDSRGNYLQGQQNLKRRFELVIANLALGGYQLLYKGKRVLNFNDELLNAIDIPTFAGGQQTANQRLNLRAGQNNQTQLSVLRKQAQRIRELLERKGVVIPEALVEPPADPRFLERFLRRVGPVQPSELPRRAPARQTPATPPTVVYKRGVSEVRKAEAAGEGINVLRKAGNRHYGNPFTMLKTPTRADVKVGTLKEAVDRYTSWLEGTSDTDLQQARRQWILDQIDNGALDNQNLLYFTKKTPNHAEALAAFVEKRKQSTEPTQPTAQPTQLELFESDPDTQTPFAEVKKVEEPGQDRRQADINLNRLIEEQRRYLNQLIDLARKNDVEVGFITYVDADPGSFDPEVVESLGTFEEQRYNENRVEKEGLPLTNLNLYDTDPPKSYLSVKKGEQTVKPKKPAPKKPAPKFAATEAVQNTIGANLFKGYRNILNRLGFKGKLRFMSVDDDISVVESTSISRDSTLYLADENRYVTAQDLLTQQQQSLKESTAAARFLRFADTQIILVDTNKINSAANSFANPAVAVNTAKLITELSHEVGHAFIYSYKTDIVGTPLGDLLVKDFEKARKRLEKAGSTKYSDEKLGFDEWFADQFAIWVRKSAQKESAKNRVDGYFRTLVNSLRSFFDEVSSLLYKNRFDTAYASQTFEEFMSDVQSSVDRGVQFDPFSTAERLQIAKDVEKTTEQLEKYGMNSKTMRYFKNKAIQMLRAGRDAEFTFLPEDKRYFSVSYIFRTASGYLSSIAPELSAMFYKKSVTTGRPGLLNVRIRVFQKKLNEVVDLKDENGKFYFRDEDGELDLDKFNEAAKQAEDDTISIDQIESVQGKAIRAWFDTLYDEYIAPSGLDIGRRENFFTRQWDKNLAVNNEQARKAIAKLLEQYNPNTKDLNGKDMDWNEFVQEWVNNDDTDIETSDVSVGLDSRRKKFWDNIPNKAARDTLIDGQSLLQEPGAAVRTYLDNLVRRVEYHKAVQTRYLQSDIDDGRLSDGLIKYMKGEGIKVGDTVNGFLATELLLSRVKDPIKRQGARQAVKNMLGKTGHDMSPFMRKLNSYGLLVNMLTLLPYAMIASLPDLAGPMMRSKGLVSFKDYFSELKYSFTNQKDAQAFARDLGIVTHDALHTMYVNAYELGHMDKTAKAWGDKFFNVILLDWYTKFSRTFAAGMGQRFLIKLAQDATGPGTLAKDNRRYLKELGLTREDVVKAYDKESGTLDTSNVKIKDALGTFVDESILRPNAAERPAWASNPYTALIFQLKSFFYAFGVNIMGGLFREMRNRYNNGNGLPAAAYPLILAASALLPLAAMGLEIREFIKYLGRGVTPGFLERGLRGVEQDDTFFYSTAFRTNGMSWGEYFLELLDRAGVFGPATIAFSMGDNAKFGDAWFTPAFGPTAERFEDLLIDGDFRFRDIYPF